MSGRLAKGHERRYCKQRSTQLCLVNHAARCSCFAFVAASVRTSVLQVVKHMVHGAPCVTITGQKGIGKTQVRSLLRTRTAVFSSCPGVHKKCICSLGEVIFVEWYDTFVPSFGVDDSGSTRLRAKTTAAHPSLTPPFFPVGTNDMIPGVAQGLRVHAGAECFRRDFVLPGG